MNTKFIIAMLMGGLLGSGPGLSYSADPMAEKEATPTIKERLTKDTINGTLMNIEGSYYVIKDDNGSVHKIHVDKSTKLDKVIAGDKVKAYVTDKGHTTTLQRAEWVDAVSVTFEKGIEQGGECFDEIAVRHYLVNKI